MKSMYFKKLFSILYKSYDESVKYLKITKILCSKNLFRYELSFFLYQFLHEILSFNFKYYYLNLDKVNNHLTRLSQKALFNQTVKDMRINLQHIKEVSTNYRVRTIMAINLKDQVQFLRYHVDLKDF